MLYIFGTYIKKNKNIRTALSSIYGIGYNNACKLCNSIGIGNKSNINNINNRQLYNIRKIIKNKYKISGDLRKYISINIKRYIEIKSYRGLRHKLSYPVRGQRTHTNAQTQKILSKDRYFTENKKIKNDKKTNKHNKK
jgi:small subunit ribosomal protein S13